MKTLYLLRHAKSSWDDDQLNDAERPLTRRGKRDCDLVAHELERNHKKFPQVFCSSANRCQETLQRFRTESDVFDHAEIHTTEDLYTFDMQQLLTWLRAGQPVRQRPDYRPQPSAARLSELPLRRRTGSARHLHLCRAGNQR